MAHTYFDLPAAGTTLSMWLAGYETAYTVIPGCTDISWDGFKRGVRTPTNLLSPCIQKKPGMPDFGQLKATVYYDPNNDVHKLIIGRIMETAAIASAHTDQFQLTYADGSSEPANVEYDGFISEFSQKFTDPETGTVSADMTIEVYNISAVTAGNPTD